MLLNKESDNLLNYDAQFLSFENNSLIGVDEAGRGALAGPVAAGAVWISAEFLKQHQRDPNILLIQDSKQLSAKRRLQAFEWLQVWQKEGGLRFASAEGSVTEIDVGNIAYATKLAFRRVLETIQSLAHLTLNNTTNAHFINAPQVLIDGYHLKNFAYDHKNIVKGDQKSFCIAAASIVAKVTRDFLMEQLSVRYPYYYLSINKGYGTRQHRHALVRYGASDMHRRSFLSKILSDPTHWQGELHL
ncbi:MAG: ribonuclease HII [Puniceicoccales bacterium]|jgi:ribonuclease HII|nr:ribonuclease HII [Puniceicoccales bacterium]